MCCGNVTPGNGYAALVCVVQPGQNAQQCAFAAAGRTNESNEFTLRRFQRNTVKNTVAAIGFADVAEGERAHWLASSATFVALPSPVWWG